MKRLAVAAALLAALGSALAMAGTGGGRPTARAVGARSLRPEQRKLLSGFLAGELRRAGTQVAPRARRRARTRAPATALNGCPRNRAGNVRANQDCQNLADPDLAGRSQAQNETTVAQDPNHPNRLVAGANDYRRGDSACYAYVSSDGGRSFGDSTPPLGFTRGTAFAGTARQYWQASGDPSVGWDTRGNAYFTCLLFNRGLAASANPDLSSGIYMLRSTQSQGRSWNFPARPVVEFPDLTGAGTTLEDKPYMTVDAHRASPYRDRVYVTWTEFAPDGTGYIWSEYSSDYGETFSARHLVSTTSPLCRDVNTTATPQGTCNQNQFSQPFTAPDGTLYVVFDNYNVTGAGGGGSDAAPRAAAADNREQVLLTRSTDGGRTFSAPIKVADYYDLPDCATYQDGKNAGSACVPEKGPTSNSFFRAANYPVGAVDPAHPRRVAVTVASYINRHSNEANGCVPTGYDPDTLQPLYDGVKTAGACNNDIVLSVSSDGGRSFTGTTRDVRELPTVGAESSPAADQFWQWAAFDPSGRLAVSYYDRRYGNDEATGYSDVSLSGSAGGRGFATRRVTGASMPPPTQFSGGFFGDYSGLSVARGTAHPTWMDTRDPELFACRDVAGRVTTPPSVCTASAPNASRANDQNIYSARFAIP
jgi:hypothetical protein